MSDFLIPALAGLDPYVPGEQPQGREYVKLNTNESPFPPSPRVLDALSREEISRLNLYSDPTALPLRRAIADTYGLSPDNVFCGNGSDEVLGFSFLAFTDGAHPVTFPAVSYGFYRVFANLFRVPTNAVPLREDFTVPVEPFLGTGGMVVLANPNAPTGISLPLAEVERIVRPTISCWWMKRMWTSAEKAPCPCLRPAPTCSSCARSPSRARWQAHGWATPLPTPPSSRTSTASGTAFTPITSTA